MTPHNVVLYILEKKLPKNAYPVNVSSISMVNSKLIIQIGLRLVNGGQDILS